MSYEPKWYERHPVWAAVAGCVVLVLLCWAGYAVKVALSPVKGAGDVIIEQHDADNMINAQRELQQRYSGIGAACTKIGIAAAAAAADPDNYVAKTNYTATQLHYQNLVAEYNALTQTLLAKNQLGDLPQHINPDNCTGVNR